MRTTRQTKRSNGLKGRTEPARQSGEGDSGEVLEGIATLLVGCGFAPEVLETQFSQVCRSLPRPREPWNEDEALYTINLSEVVAEWHDDPRYVDGRGRPLLLPLHGPAPSVAALVKPIFPTRSAESIIGALVTTGAVRPRHGRYECVSRSVLFNAGREASVRALLVIRGVLSRLARNLAGHSSGLEQAAISARVPVRDVPKLNRVAGRLGLPVLQAMDVYMRGCARRAKAAEPRALVAFGTYLNDFSVEGRPGVVDTTRGGRSRRSAGQASPRRSNGVPNSSRVRLRSGRKP